MAIDSQAPYPNCYAWRIDYLDESFQPTVSDAKRRNGETDPGRVLVIHPSLRGEENRRRPEARLAEACGLASAIALDIVATEITPFSQPKPSTFLGRGAVERLAGIVAEKKADLVIVDAHLSPIQQRNLERGWACKVIDRTGLILEIFGARARTREGRMQVELAALSYQRSRLVRSWTHLERQRGGFGFMGGPGETQIEADRRLIGERIVRLKKELEDVKRTRRLHREARSRVPYPIIALVGYTNAGKSTLFNMLTKASVVARDQLFATLDPTMRALDLPSGQKAILSDTVGFVSDLPHELVAAFRATLEEVLEADIIVHVRDIAHPDSEAQKSDVENVLRDLGLEKTVDQGLVEVLNKVDLLPDERRAEIINQTSRSRSKLVLASALCGEGGDHVLELLGELLAAERDIADFNLDLSDGSSIAWLYRHGEVIARTDDENEAHISVRLASGDRRRFEKIWGGNRERFGEGG
ncbi:GTPase HflX [Alphaproteobacteria bacterium]|nr:GTPase HflX [Alphaproteobacteria bacterium]